jgi:hypothetical protein
VFEVHHISHIYLIQYLAVDVRATPCYILSFLLLSFHLTSSFFLYSFFSHSFLSFTLLSFSFSTSSISSPSSLYLFQAETEALFRIISITETTETGGTVEEEEEVLNLP